MALRVAYQAPHRSASLRPTSTAVTAAMIEIGKHDEEEGGAGADGVGVADRRRVRRIGHEGHQTDADEADRCKDRLTPRTPSRPKRPRASALITPTRPPSVTPATIVPVNKPSGGLE